MITKQLLIEKTIDNDTDFFWDIYCEGTKDTKCEIVYDQSYGDGNEYTIALNFSEFDIIIQLEGTYSSWDSPYWNKVVLAMPYEFKETRYKEVTTSYLREKSLNEILNDFSGSNGNQDNKQ
jgi:hypothetical protein